jgi:ribonuclease E
VQFGTISKFGLLEMSRQRLKPALSEGASIPARAAAARATSATPKAALQILRIIQEESMKDNTAAVHVQVPVEVASFLLNEKRTEIAKIELKQRVNVTLVPNKTLETPHYKLERLKHDDPRLDDIDASYKLAEEFEDPTHVTRRSQEPTNRSSPSSRACCPTRPCPHRRLRPCTNARSGSRRAGLGVAPQARRRTHQRLMGWLKGLFGTTPAPQPTAAPAPVANTAPAADDKREAAVNAGRVAVPPWRPWPWRAQRRSRGAAASRAKARPLLVRAASAAPPTATPASRATPAVAPASVVNAASGERSERPMRERRDAGPNGHGAEHAPTDEASSSGRPPRGPRGEGRRGRGDELREREDALEGAETAADTRLGQRCGGHQRAARAPPARAP